MSFRKGLLLLGHVYMILLVIACQTLVYREVTALFSLATTESDPHNRGIVKARDPWSKTLNWYFFAVTNYFLYGESIIHYFKVCYLFYMHTLTERTLSMLYLRTPIWYRSSQIIA